MYVVVENVKQYKTIEKPDIFCNGIYISSDVAEPSSGHITDVEKLKTQHYLQ